MLVEMDGEAVSDLRFRVAFVIDGVVLGTLAGRVTGVDAAEDVPGMEPWLAALFCFCGELSADNGAF